MFEPAIFVSAASEADARLALLGNAPGFFVDVGAFDPVRGSQSYALEQMGWRGVLVEPQPDRAEKLRAGRSAMVFECACGAPSDSGRARPLQVSGAYSSLTDYVIGRGRAPTIEVAMRTLDDILDEAEAPTPLDFVSIDTEGWELPVLQGFDLARWRPRLLVIENHALDSSRHDHLTARGYRWIRRYALNDWFVPEHSAATVSLFGKWQHFRKFRLGTPLRRWREQRVRRRTLTKLDSK